MCEKAADAYLTSLKLVPDYFDTNKIFEKLNKTVLSIDDIELDHIETDVTTYFSNNMDLNIIDLNDINFDDNNFDEEDPETIIHVRLTAWCNRYKQHKAYEKEMNKELMLAV